jgi:hypothetical protein
VAARAWGQRGSFCLPLPMATLNLNVNPGNPVAGPILAFVHSVTASAICHVTFPFWFPWLLVVAV